MVVLKVADYSRSAKVCYPVLLPKKKKKGRIMRQLKKSTQGIVTQVYTDTHIFFSPLLYHLFSLLICPLAVF